MVRFAALGILLIWFVAFSSLRLIARDEGFYLLASKLVFSGQVPYTDFFYPQMPLIPYLYGIIGRVSGDSIVALRLFSGVLSFAIVLSLYATLKRSVGEWWALFGACLLSFTNMYFPWMTTLQTYAPTTLFLMLAFCLALTGPQRCKLFAGVALGLAVLGRLPVVAVVPVFSLWLWWTAERAALRKFHFGVICTLVVVVPFGALSPDAFFFNNIGYHLARSSLSFSEGLQQKGTIASILLGLRETAKFSAPHIAVLYWGAFIGVWIRGATRSARLFALILVLVLSGINLIPTPSYVQYFCIVTPFLVFIVVCAFADGLGSTKSVPRRLSGTFVALLVALWMISSAPLEMIRYTTSGEGVIGIGDMVTAKSWTVHTVREVSAKIDSLLDRGETAAALWPGYLYESAATSVPGLENQFAFTAAEGLNEDKARTFHVLSREHFVDDVRKQLYPLVVGQKRMIRSFRSVLEDSHYARCGDVEQVLLYCRSDVTSDRGATHKRDSQ